MEKALKVWMAFLLCCALGGLLVACAASTPLAPPTPQAIANINDGVYAAAVASCTSLDLLGERELAVPIVNQLLASVVMRAPAHFRGLLASTIDTTLKIRAFSTLWPMIRLLLSRLALPTAEAWYGVADPAFAFAACGCGQGLQLAIPIACDDLLAPASASPLAREGIFIPLAARS